MKNSVSLSYGQLCSMLTCFLLLLSTTFNHLSAQCCTINPILDNSYEESFSASERFPNSSVTSTNNALTYDPTNWSYADGTYGLDPTIINDASRASEGNQFAYVPNPSGTPTYNKCLGNSLSYTSSYSCQSDYYTTGIRYIVSFDYVAFNQAAPSGGTGSTTPKFEYMSPSLIEMPIYDSGGNALNSAETAVAWNDIASSWNRAYGLVPASSSTSGMTLWFSHDRFGTCGMLIDNTDLEMIELTDHGMTNVVVTNETEVTFSLNPTNNVVGIPNLSYEVVAPNGLTVSPSTGYYNQTTNFTLTGNLASSVGSTISINVRDEVNTGCSVTASISNPYSPDNDEIPNIDDLDDDNDGISDAQELCGTNPVLPVLSTPVDFTINLDNYPTETTWSLSGPSGVVTTGGPYPNAWANQTLSRSITLTENGSYTLHVEDSYGDGMLGNTYSIDGVDFPLSTTAFTTGYDSYDYFTVTSINPSAFTCLSADPMDDSDNDGILNYKDSDFCTLNSAGVCNSMDADGDGIINSLDKDSDNDGIPDVIESGSIDTNGDGVVDSTTDVDGDGFMDPYDNADSGSGAGEVTNGTMPNNPDTDGDGLNNLVDLDSDNDGIPDIVEVNGIDTNGDGRVDNSTDADNDGLADIYDPDDDGTFGIDSGEGNSPLVETDGSGNLFNSGTGNSLNTDSDSYPDYLDLDADNDGIPDIVEVGASDSDNDGMVNTASLPWDADGDGLADIYDENASDGPSGSGTNGTALVETSTDTNGDGLINNSESMEPGGSNKIHADNDNISNHLDIDADDDGITDVVENAGGDTDADNGGTGSLNGRVHNFTDSNNDGWHDSSTSNLTNSDTDTHADYVDVDADNDGISDYVEGVCTSCPTSSGPTGSDTDGDGLLDIYENLTADNTDNVGGTNQGVDPNLDDDDLVDNTPDYLDTDADEDGTYDWNEGFDSNGDGSAMDDLLTIAANYESSNGNPGEYPVTDSDADGVPDWADNRNGFGYDESLLPPFLDAGSIYWVDSDNDGLVALFDTDENGTAAPTPDNNAGNDNDWRDNSTIVSLPVELIQFSASEDQCAAVLEWTSTNEVDFDYFDIERSLDGITFESLFKVASIGGETEQQYTWKDQMSQPFAVYRLKMVDVDGSFVYSDLKTLEINCSNVSVYPNPVSLVRGSITLNFTKGVIPHQVEIYNQFGQLVQKIILENRYVQVLEMDISSLSAGTYFLNTGERSSHKIMIME